MFFYIAVAIGAIMCAIGFVLAAFCLSQQFSLNNLQPVLQLAAGLVFFVFGAMVVSLSVRIRWMRRVERKLDEALQANRDDGSPRQ